MPFSCSPRLNKAIAVVVTIGVMQATPSIHACCGRSIPPRCRPCNDVFISVSSLFTVRRRHYSDGDVVIPPLIHVTSIFCQRSLRHTRFAYVLCIVPTAIFREASSSASALYLICAHSSERPFIPISRRVSSLIISPIFTSSFFKWYSSLMHVPGSCPAYDTIDWSRWFGVLRLCHVGLL